MYQSNSFQTFSRSNGVLEVRYAATPTTTKNIVTMLLSKVGEFLSILFIAVFLAILSHPLSKLHSYCCYKHSLLSFSHLRNYMMCNSCIFVIPLKNAFVNVTKKLCLWQLNHCAYVSRLTVFLLVVDPLCTRLFSFIMSLKTLKKL